MSRAYRRGKAVSRVSFSLIAGIFLVLSTSVAVGVANQLHRISFPTTGNAVVTAPRYLVVFVLDGGRLDYLNLQKLPHLDALRRQGTEYDRAMAGILESETPAGHATLSTGSTPAHDGLLGFNWITSANDAVHLFDPNVVRQGGIEHVMQQAGAPTIASLFKRRYPSGKVVAVSGHKYYAADPLGGPAADYILYYSPGPNNTYVPAAIPGHVPPASVLNGVPIVQNTTLPPATEDHLAVDLALSAFQRVHQQISLINLPEFDWPQGHVDGANLTKAQALMQGFDQDLGRVEDAYRKAGVLDQTLFVVTADHGMVPLTTVIPDSVLDNAVSQAGTTSNETTYSTGGFIWLQNSAAAQQVAANVAAAGDTHVQSVYYKTRSKTGDSYVRAGGLSVSAAADNANQYLLKSFLGGNAPDVVAFCTEGAAFENTAAKNWKGNHGGGSWESQHIPLILSGPGVKAGQLSHAPARLEDIAPTVLDLLGSKSTGMDGWVLADALTHPSSAQTRAQSQLDGLLTPVVDALQNQSRHELGSQTSH